VNPEFLPPFVRWLVPPLIFLAFVLFGLGWFLPKAWAGIEWLWWNAVLGRSRTGKSIRTLAVRDFRLLIREKEVDDGAARPLAVLLAIGSRMGGMFRLTRDLKRLAKEKEDVSFETSIQNLNEGWRSGMPPPILAEYMQDIQGSVGGINRHFDKLRGQCAVANVTYLLGNLTKGNELAKENWRYAESHESKTDYELKWMASYALFNSTLFLGDFQKAMKLMADFWLKHFANLKEVEKDNVIGKYENCLTVNPVLSVPRHMILAAAFAGEPKYDPEFWPSPDYFNRLTSSEERNDERIWLTSWYETAKSMCQSQDDVISLDFSHAYAGFHLTLMYNDPGRLGHGAKDDLSRRAREAFESITDSSPIVSRYAKWGFFGIYHLVTGDPEEALKSLRRAAEYSAISGNKFADCIFTCCHAVAAQRADRHLKPEVDYYLAEANRLAKRLGRAFYWDLCQAASAEVSSLREKPAQADRLDARSRIGRASKRILGIFRSESKK
jgi:hypothetical protein